MSRTKFELNVSGLNKLMKSAEMQSVANRAASKIAAVAGEEYGMSSKVLSFDSLASVYPETYEAKKNNRDNNTLDKAMRSVSV